MAETQDRDKYLQLHREFHDQIYRAAQRPQLLALITSLEECSSVYLRVLLDHIDNSESAVDAHRLILDTLRFGDAEQARTAVAAHLRRNFELIEMQLNPDEDVEIDRPSSAASAQISVAQDGAAGGGVATTFTLSGSAVAKP
jgi:DNA-binding GntR family transcriptional regulator